MPRINELDDFETALRKIVGKSKDSEESANILRQAAERLPKMANALFESGNENTVLVLADQLGLNARGVLRVHYEFAEGDIFRTTLLLMAARQSSRLTQEVLKEAFVNKIAAETLRRQIPAIWLEVEPFMQPAYMAAFIRATSGPSGRPRLRPTGVPRSQKPEPGEG